MKEKVYLLVRQTNQSVTGVDFSCPRTIRVYSSYDAAFIACQAFNKQFEDASPLVIFSVVEMFVL